MRAAFDSEPSALGEDPNMCTSAIDHINGFKIIIAYI
jgi:hypothetical protein